MSSNNSKNTSNAKANNASKGNNKNGGSSWGKIFFYIFTFIFVVFIIYLIYFAYVMVNRERENAPVIINDVIDAYVARPAFELPTPTVGLTQSFSTWIYVKDWNYRFGQYKNILWRGNPSTKSGEETKVGLGNIHSPSLWLYPLSNSLKVVTSTSAPEVESCDIQNIPLMTWVHIVYVLNNRTVDVYVNGKLERSCALRGIPTITTDPVYVTSGAPEAGFYGKMGKTQYFTKALLPNDVATLYQQGPLGSTQYQVSFFTDGQIIKIDQSDSFTS